jgi:hypothetical protein
VIWIAAGLVLTAFVVGVVVISSMVAGAREDAWIAKEGTRDGDTPGSVTKERRVP